MKHQPPYIIFGRGEGWILLHYSPGGRELRKTLAGGMYRDETEAVREAADFLECEPGDITVMATRSTGSAFGSHFPNICNRKAPMQIPLTRAMLTAKNACPEAIADLERFFGSPDNWTVDWTPEKQIEILKGNYPFDSGSLD